MDDFFLWNRWLHITCGFVGFFVAPAALATAKGGRWHRRWGKVFFWAMLTAACAAILGAWHGQNLFLLLTGVFTIYLLWQGYRALDQKKLPRGQRPARRDWVAAGLGLVIFVGFAGFGIRTGQIVATVFGTIGTLLALGELRKLRAAPNLDKHRWFFDHMRGFIISYIAALSAFSATSFSFIHSMPVRFLWPTVVISPLMSWWIATYRRRFAGGQRPTDVATVREAV